jgi:acyl-Coa thioesterase superfamily protein/acyl-CoA thioesterase superfamily protein
VTASNLDFSVASAVRRQSDDRWNGNFLDGWDLGGIPNGGYQLAVATQVALAATAHPDPLSMHAMYLRRARTGAFTALTTLANIGTRQSALHISIVQDDAVVTAVSALMGSLDRAVEQTLWGDAEPPEIPEPDACTRMVYQPGQMLPPPIVNQMDVRLHPEDFHDIGTGTLGQARMRGWTRFKDGHPMDSTRAMLVSDVFPPPILNSTLPRGWVPTMTLTVQMRKRPTSEWLAGHFTTTVTNGPYLAENGELWDDRNELVATVQQLAGMPRP